MHQERPKGIEVGGQLDEIGCVQAIDWISFIFIHIIETWMDTVCDEQMKS